MVTQYGEGRAVQVHRVAMTDGATLAAYLDLAAENAPWVVFSNSLATDWSIWDAQVNALASGWNVLRYDQRGHGASSLPSEKVDFVQLGSDVAALLDRFEIGQAVFVGLSMGVPTGLAAVAQAPARFSGLLLSDGQAKTAPGGGEQWRDRIDLVRAQGMQDYAKATACRWLAEPSGIRLARLEDMIAATKIEGFIACAQALADFDFDAVLETIAVPTLLVAGERDGKLPETMRAMAARIPAAQFETIAGAGHVPCHEQPEAFNRIMVDFLENLT